MRPRHTFQMVLAATFACFARRAAAQVTLPFTTAATGAVFGTVNGEPVVRFQLTNDFAQQTFAGAGLPASVGALGLSLRFQDQATVAAPYTFDVFLNGTGVGSFGFATGGGFPAPSQIDPTYRLLSSPSFTFAPIAAIGGGYTVRIVQTSASLTSGEGNILMVRGGANPSTATFAAATTTPEPATIGLVALGIVGVAAGRRRSRG